MITFNAALPAKIIASPQEQTTINTEKLPMPQTEGLISADKYISPQTLSFMGNTAPQTLAGVEKSIHDKYMNCGNLCPDPNIVRMQALFRNTFPAQLEDRIERYIPTLRDKIKNCTDVKNVTGLTVDCLAKMTGMITNEENQGKKLATVINYLKGCNAKPSAGCKLLIEEANNQLDEYVRINSDFIKTERDALVILYNNSDVAKAAKRYKMELLDLIHDLFDTDGKNGSTAIIKTINDQTPSEQRILGRFLREEQDKAERSTDKLVDYLIHG